MKGFSKSFTQQVCVCAANTNLRCTKSSVEMRKIMNKIITGAFEALGISGVSLANGKDVLGIRLGVPHYSIGLYDDKDVLLNLKSPMPYAPDQSYTRYIWQVPVTDEARFKVASFPRKKLNNCPVFDFAEHEAAQIVWEWTFDGCNVWGRYTCDKEIQTALIVNGCFSSANVKNIGEKTCILEQGKSLLYVNIDGCVEKIFTTNTRDEIEQCFYGVENIKGVSNVVYKIILSPENPLYVKLHMSEKSTLMNILPNSIDKKYVDELLLGNSLNYESSRMKSEGLFSYSAESVADLSGYSRTYDPVGKTATTSVNRTWAGHNQPGPVFGWDNFFTSYIASYENPVLASQSLQDIVEEYEKGNIAYGPTQKNLIIPILYCKTIDIIGDLTLAKKTWKVMMDFMRFWFSESGEGYLWRDGNNDGLIEPGSSHSLKDTPLHHIISDAMDETGYDELPIYSRGFTDERRGFPINGVELEPKSKNLSITLICQNSLYISSCNKMSILANTLGEKSDATWLLEEACRVKSRMKESLYSKEHGIYLDKLWNGEFVDILTMRVFYPLLVDGLTDTSIRQTLRTTLMDPEKFWGENLIPTVSRDEKAYCDSFEGKGNYWRGNCWPSSTYIVYLAIKEAGWDDIAAEYAKKVNAQFMKYWQNYSHAYENYPPEGDVDHNIIYPPVWGGREVRYVWSALMPLCALEELFSPETIGVGIRFGNPYITEQSKWYNFLYKGIRISAETGPENTKVEYGNKWTFFAKPGVAIRHFVWTEDCISFQANVLSTVSFHIGYTGKYCTKVYTGNNSISFENLENTVVFSLVSGQHDIKILFS